MKRRDIWKMALLRARTSAGRRTSFTIAVGIMLLLPVVWILLGFYGEIYADIDDAPPQLLFAYEYRDLGDVYVYGDKSEQRYQTALLSNTLEKSDVESAAPGRELAPQWEELIYEQGELLTDGAGMAPDGSDSLKIKVVSPDSQGNYLPADAAGYLRKNKGEPLKGEGFSENGAEIYVSARLLEKLGISSAEALGKKFSLRISLGADNDQYVYDDNNASRDPHACTAEGVGYVPPQGEVYVFYEFAVAGVIEDVYYENVKDEADIWVKRSSLFMDGIDLMPQLSLQDIYNENGRTEACAVLTYPQADVKALAERAAQKGAFVPLFSGLSRFDGADHDNLGSRHAFVQYKSFSEAKEAYENFRRLKGGFYNVNAEDAPFLSQLAAVAEMVGDTDMACAVLGVLGLVTFVACAIDYMNAAAFNLRKRRGFLEMMKKMGVTEKDKRTLIFYETAAIYVRAAVIAGIVTLLALAIGAVVIAAAVPQASRAQFYVALAYAIPAALIIAVLMAVTAGLAFAYVTAGERKKKTE